MTTPATPEPADEDIRRALDELDERLARNAAALAEFGRTLAETRTALANLRNGEVKATHPECSPDPAKHLTVMAAAVRDVWQLALQWQGHDDTEQQAGDIFTALSPLVAWEAEHLPVAEVRVEVKP